MELEFSGVTAPTRRSRGKRGSGACNAAAIAPGPLLSERVKESLVLLMLSPPRRKPGPIVPPHEPVIVGKPCDCLRSSRRRAMGPGFRRDDKGGFVYPNLDPVFSQALSRGRRQPVWKTHFISGQTVSSSRDRDQAPTSVKLQCGDRPALPACGGDCGHKAPLGLPRGACRELHGRNGGAGPTARISLRLPGQHSWVCAPLVDRRGTRPHSSRPPESSDRAGRAGAGLRAPGLERNRRGLPEKSSAAVPP